MEILLGGKTHPQKAKAFTGLKAPKWPENFLGTIDRTKAMVGKGLYKKRCAGCHRPAVSSGEFWSDKYWKKITPNGAKYYEVRVLPDNVIGTDTAQAKVLAEREIDLTKFGIEGEVCRISGGKMDMRPVKAAPKQSFALALGLTVGAPRRRPTTAGRSRRPARCVRARPR